MSMRETEDELGIVEMLEKRAGDALYEGLLPPMEGGAPTPEEMARLKREAAEAQKALRFAHRIRDARLRRENAANAARGGPQEPQLQDFGIEPEEYVLYIGEWTRLYGSFPLAFLGTVVAVGLIAGGIAYVATTDTGRAIWVGGGASALTFLTGGAGVPLLIIATTGRIKRSRLLKSPVASRIKLYQEARTAYATAQWQIVKARKQAEMKRQEAERAQQEKRWAAEEARQSAEQARRRAIYDHWMSLSGSEFERELGTLYGHLGFSVESTPKSGDQGIDLILRRDGATTVVQCKAHQSLLGLQSFASYMGAWSLTVLTMRFSPALGVSQKGSGSLCGANP